MTSTAPALRVARLEEARTADFFALHSERHDAGLCFCVAWWVPSWDGWSERTAQQNRSLRADLLARGQHDGYLGYLGEEVVAWCQVGPRDRLTKLVRQYALAADPEAWAITCFLVAPAHRRRGVARQLLAGALADLRRRGVRRVQAFPRPLASGPGELWTGPAALFRGAGFGVRREDPERPVLELTLS